LINDGSTVFLGDGSANINGLGSGLVTLDGGTLNLLYTTNEQTQNGTFTNNIQIDNGFTGTIDATLRGDISGALTGSGTLDMDVDYVRGNIDGNWSAFTGQINVSAGSLGGDFRLNNLNGFGTASLNLGAGVSLYITENYAAGTANINIGALSGAAGSFLSAQGSNNSGRVGTYIVGGANTTATFAGIIQDDTVTGANQPTAITKVGTQAWILTGSNDYSGATTITSGTLQIGNGGNSGTLGTGSNIGTPSTVTDNASLVFDRSDTAYTAANLIDGTGTVTVTGGGTIALTNANGFFGGAIINGGSTLNINGQYALGGADYGGLTFNNGTLQYATSLTGSNGTADISQSSTGTAEPVTFAGNATIDTNGNNVTYADTIGNSGTGGLTIASSAGGGSLTLSATETYTGATNVNTGAKLILASGGALANTAVTVNTGATLLALTGNGGIGTGSGSITLAGGSTLSLVGDSALGNLAVNGGMTVGGSTFADIDLELNTDTSTADTITVTGSPVSYGAAGGLIFLTDISGTNAPATGTPFTLITDPAGLGAANFSLGTTSLTIDGQSYALTLSNSTSTSEIVTLTAASLNFYWTGQAGTSWSNISNFVTAPSGGAAQSGSLSASSNVFLTANSPTAGHVASQTIDGNYIINSLSFTGTGTGAATTAITLGIGSGTALTIDAFNTFSDANANNYPIGTGLVVQPGSAAHIINANINLGSSQTWDINNSPSKPLTMNGVVADSISGSGFSLTKTGTGTLIIANADTYDGGTVVNAGTLMLASGGSLLSTGNLTVGGTGTFDLGGNAQTIGNLSDGGSSGGVITSSNGAGTLTVTETLPNTYSGAINDLNGVNGSVVTLVVSGTSNLILSGSSNFTGGVTLTSGNLTVANNYALGNPTSTNLNAGLNLSPSSGTVTASFTSANPNIASLNGSGNVILGNTSGSGTSTTLIIGEGGQAASSDSIFSGVISDLSATNPNAVGNLEIVGGGLVTLDSANTFTGTTVISGTGPLGPSELILQSAGALENSTLNFNNQGGILSLGSLITMTLGGLTGSEAFSLSNGSNPITLTIGNNNVTSVYTGNLTGPGALVKVGTGSFTVGSGTNGGANYTGNTTVNNGTLVIGGTSSITGNIDVTGIQGVSNLVLADNVVVKTGTIVLIDSGDPTPGTAFPAAASLTLKNNASLTAPNVQMGNASRVATGTFITIQDNASLTTGTLTLVDTIGGTASDDQLNLNGGTLTLNTFNLFTATGGATQAPTINFNGGILAAAASDNPGTVTFLGAFTFLNAKVFNGGALINTNGFDITIAQPLTSGTSTDGGLTAMGAGGILTLTGSNSYLGATTINPGVTLQLGNGTAGSDGTITASGGITDNGTLIYNRAGSPTSGVAISGSGNLVISGTGSQTLTGVNTFTGPTTINTGATLQLGNGAAGNDGTILNTTGILDNGTLIYNRSGVLSTSVAIHGSGNVTMSGTGTQTLAGVDSYTGATTVSGSGGRLIVSGSLTGTTSVSVAPGAHLEIDGQLNPAITPTISGFLNGTGSLGAATIASGGTLAPNFTSSATAAGALTTAGNVNFADGTTTFSIRLGIALPTDANQLNVTSGGLVTLNDATLHLTLGTAFNNATEPANFVYVIINGGAQNTGSGSDVFANAPLTGDSITVANTAIFDVFYAVNSTNTGMGSDIDLEFVGAIPEPSTWAELLAGAALLFLYRRSRRKAAASR
jgi:autotransporter-associated beta strand protein